MGNVMPQFFEKNIIDEDAKSGIGPRGKGDPEDYSLRHTEIYVNIPAYQSVAARDQECKYLVDAYLECSERLFGNFFTCKDLMTEINDCTRFWAHNEKYREEITQEYLLVRQEYRKTGRRRLYRALKGETYITKEKLEGYMV